MLSVLVKISEYFLPTLFLILFVIACVFYIKRKSFRNLVIVAIVGRILHAGILMFLQYSIWSEGGMGSYFLTAPIAKDLPIDGIKYFEWLFDNKFGYFLFYSWGRFWFSVVLSVAAAYIFYAFLRLLKRKTERFFEYGEPELGLLCALIAGWPLFVIFIPFVFISVILVSLVRLIVWKEQYTTLGIPFLVALLGILLLGNYFMQWFGIGVLKV